MHSNLRTASLFYLERRSGYYYLPSPRVNVFVAPPLPLTQPPRFQAKGRGLELDEFE